MRLLIKNGTVVSPDGLRRTHVLCEDGRIAAHLDETRDVQVDELYDATGQLVLPGLIDPHVHSRDPGQTSKEDFAHSTAAALCSGVTTVLEMPNALPPVTTKEVFEERVAAHERVAWTDFGLWGQAIGTENSDDLAGIFAAGAVAVKLFWGYALDRANRRLIYNIAGTAPESLILPPDLGAVLEIFRQAAIANGVIAAHCEDRELLTEAESRVGPIATYNDLLASRPAVAEAASVALGIELARVTGARFHVVHASSARTVALIESAQRSGLPVTGEACPHYLTLTADEAERIGPASKVFPPIRDAAEQAALWGGIDSGAIVSLGSDHAPHAPEEKSKSLADAPAGVHGVETMVPLLLDRMTGGRISPQRVARVLSSGTAELYGLAHRKGHLRPGADADLTIVDPDREWQIDQSRLHTLHRASIFHGRRGRGQAVAAVLGGEIVMRDGEPVGERKGRFVAARHAGQHAGARNA
jgi:allantoinase